MTSRRCEAATLAGEPCRRFAGVGTDPPRCSTHETGRTVPEADFVRREQQHRFLEFFGRAMNISAAAEYAGVTYSTFRVWRRVDVDFEIQFIEARTGCMDRIESALFRRAVGQKVVETTIEDTPLGERRKTVEKWVASDRAAEMLLKVHGGTGWHDRTNPGIVPDDPFVDILNDPEKRAALDAIIDG